MNLLRKIHSFLKKTLGGFGLEHLFPINIFYKLLVKSIKSDYAVVCGHKMFLDSQDSLNLSVNGIYEPTETELINREIRPGDVVLDIGANIGYYTLQMAKLVGSSGKVYAFEPDPTNFEILLKNISLNEYNNIVPINKAVSDKTGDALLFLNEENKGDHRLYSSQDSRSSKKVKTISIDDYFSKKKIKISFIKMDIQGSEVKAFNGMKKIISQNKKLKIISEFWPEGISMAGDNSKKYFNSLLQKGFLIKEISETKKSIEITSQKKLSSYFKDNPKDFTNIFCVRK